MSDVFGVLGWSHVTGLNTNVIDEFMLKTVNQKTAKHLITSKS